LFLLLRHDTPPDPILLRGRMVCFFY
jgi:hypothetical protein